jgi:cytohesin
VFLLTLAIQATNLEIVSLLFKYGATTGYPGDPNERHPNWRPHIYKLIESNSPNFGLYRDPSRTGTLFEILVGHGEDVTWRNSIGRSLLHHASEINNTVYVIWVLIRHGVNVKTTDGFAAVHVRTEEAAVELIENGAQVDITNSVGDTPLHLNTWNEDLQRIFLDAGANPNCKNHNGESVLLRAATTADRAVVELLIERGADVNSRNFGKETPLLRAARYGR